MATRSQSKNTAFQTEIRAIRELDQFIREEKRMIQDLKRQNEQKRRNSILANMIKIMHTNGASGRSIQRALPGLDEFAKFAIKMDVSSASGANPHEPQPAVTPNEEALGFLLSEVKTQEVG